MRLLFIGDVFGKPGRRALGDCLEQIKRSKNVSWVIVNGENAAGGSGLTERIARNLFDAGVDVITGGNHLCDKPGHEELLMLEKRIVAPANEEPNRGGSGFYLAQKEGLPDIAVINLLGRVFMREVGCPFEIGKQVIERARQKTPIVIVDFHAEATSEKRAFGHYVDGQASAVLGTHTHIQTADEEILPKGTAYITDVGMSGPHDSVIGLKKENIVHRFLSGEKVPFQVATGGVKVQTVLLEIDPKTGMAESIERINVEVEDL